MKAATIVNLDTLRIERSFGELVRKLQAVGVEIDRNSCSGLDVGGGNGCADDVRGSSLPTADAGGKSCCAGEGKGSSRAVSTVSSRALQSRYIGVKGRLFGRVGASQLIEAYRILADHGYRLISIAGVEIVGIEGRLRSQQDAHDRPSGILGAVYVFSGRDSIVALEVSGERIPSLAGELPVASYFEREASEMFGLTFEGSPDSRRWLLHGNWPDGLCPLRKSFPVEVRPERADLPYEFTKVEGDGVFQIPVGPVHAGIIEPGHFRFSVAGEQIINLEAKLGYVHKGIEKVAEGLTFDACTILSERISGDESFANSLAFCLAVEEATGVEAPPRAQQIRTVCAELERVFSHAGDIAGLCTDVGFGAGTAQAQLIRIWTQQLFEDLTGSRVLRNVNRPGGVRRDVFRRVGEGTLSTLDRIEDEFRDTCEMLLSRQSFLDRFTDVGVLRHEDAVAMNAVGPAGRASGRDLDVRRDLPYCWYGHTHFGVPVEKSGDIRSRMMVKMNELTESLSIVRQVLRSIVDGEIVVKVPEGEPGSVGISVIEAPRGESVHFVVIGAGGTIYRYKIRTASFCNWPALCLAVNGNVVPDFPLINKSFNLSYSGNDL